MKKIILLTVFLPALFSCKTTEPLPVVPEPQEVVVQEDSVPVAEPAAEEAEVVIPEEQVATENDVMVVSEDLYNRTFDEIENLIDELTKLIRKKNFNGWKNFLSEKYIEKVGSAEYLREVSESPSLKDIVELKSLRDYFQWVVVPSRASARLDEIIFKDETHVTAYMYIDENPTILFQFELIDGEWAVTVW
ncbi:hypothetical protein [Spirochaeta isovalerica]|uniref:Lipoprotein n=1 Tax=Spirochaeta isovalerica TaxID=150 RepID=A0A841R271_9SPIO|nr:hypothetical protein [Spirochaeta isovalerica]MBB6479114.1 hypothetical protein [Spirochaeta isovalerica]